MSIDESNHLLLDAVTVIPEHDEMARIVKQNLTLVMRGDSGMYPFGIMMMNSPVSPRMQHENRRLHLFETTPQNAEKFTELQYRG